MSQNASYMPAIELSRRIGWEMTALQQWAKDHDADHPRFGWLIRLDAAEELLSQLAEAS